MRQKPKIVDIIELTKHHFAVVEFMHQKAKRSILSDDTRVQPRANHRPAMGIPEAQRTRRAQAVSEVLKSMRSKMEAAA